MDAADDDDNGISPSRLRILAVRRLGYTHTECGKRKMRQLIEEMAEDARSGKQDKNGDDGSWIGREVM